MVSRAVREAWEGDKFWHESDVVVIRPQLFTNDGGTPFWMIEKEAANLNLTTSRVLNDNETERFVDWSSGNLSVMFFCCLEEWAGKKL